MERLQAEQAEMLDHERTKREEWESVQVLHFLQQKGVKPKVHIHKFRTRERRR